MDETRSPGIIQYHRKRKTVVGINSLPDELLISILSRLHPKEATRTSILSHKWRCLWRFTVVGINILPDELLISILSRLNLKEATRTSILSHKWRYLWRFTFGSLDFNFRDDKARNFGAFVNGVLKLHRGSRLDSFILCFYDREALREIKKKQGPAGAGRELLRCISFAMKKEVKTFNLSCIYTFPSMEQLSSLKSPFVSLRSLQLACIKVKDEEVHYFLASCPYLESISLTDLSIKNLRIDNRVPNLKYFHITDFSPSVEIYASPNLVSFSINSCTGTEVCLKNVPNLSELTLRGDCTLSFLYDLDKHSTYSVQLVKLSLTLPVTLINWPFPDDLPLLYSLKRLEVKTVHCERKHSLLFFTELIKSSPLLSEFRIKIDCKFYEPFLPYGFMPFPSISEAETTILKHNNLKLVEIVGYIGSTSDEEFILQLFKVAPLIEKMVIEVGKKDFNHNRMEKAKERANYLKSNFPVIEVKVCYVN